jgi:hypothetical protein
VAITLDTLHHTQKETKYLLHFYRATKVLTLRLIADSMSENFESFTRYYKNVLCFVSYITRCCILKVWTFQMTLYLYWSVQTETYHETKVLQINFVLILGYVLITQWDLDILSQNNTIFKYGLTQWDLDILSQNNTIFKNGYYQIALNICNKCQLNNKIRSSSTDVIRC